MIRVRLIWLLVLALMIPSAVVSPSAPDVQAHHKCGHLKPVPGECPPTPVDTYVVRIYDYTDLYHTSMQYTANLYAGYLAPYGVTVEYHDMPAEPFATCIAHETPLYGIRACEDIRFNGDTAAATGSNWREVAPGQWENSAATYFYSSRPDANGGMDGRAVTCHEIGHTFDLIHTFDASDQNCMTVLGCWCPDTLSPWQVELIGTSLPKSASATSVERDGTRDHSKRNPHRHHKDRSR